MGFGRIWGWLRGMVGKKVENEVVTRITTKYALSTVLDLDLHLLARSSFICGTTLKWLRMRVNDSTSTSALYPTYVDPPTKYKSFALLPDRFAATPLLTETYNINKNNSSHTITLNSSQNRNI